jgi:L-lactate permease
MELAGLTGAAAGEQRAMANQMSSMGMTANMYGQQAAQSASMFAAVLGAVGSAFTGSITF